MANNINFDIIIKSQKALAELRKLNAVAKILKMNLVSVNKAVSQAVKVNNQAALAANKLAVSNTKVNIATTKMVEAQTRANIVTQRLKKSEIQTTLAGNRLTASNKKLEKSQSKVSKTNKKSSSTFGSLFKSVTAANIAANAATSIFRGLGRIFKDSIVGSITIASSFEKLQTQIEVLTQDTAVAKDLFKDFVDFSANSPFRLQDIAESGQKLLAFGFSAEETKEQLRILGDVAGATGAKLPEIARVIGQINSKGNLTGERNLQLLERGIVLYPELARVIRVSESELEKLQKQGKISAENVNKALKNLTEEGGNFFEGAIRLAKTASGVYSILRDNIDLTGKAIGDKLLPFLKFAGIELIKVSKSVSAWVNENIKLAKVLAGVASIIDVVTFSAGLVVRAFAGVRIAFAFVQRVIQAGLNVAMFQAIGSIELLTKGAGLLIGAFSKEKGDKINAFAAKMENLRKSVNLGGSVTGFIDDVDKISNGANDTANSMEASGDRIKAALEKFVLDPKNNDLSKSNDERIARQKALLALEEIERKHQEKRLELIKQAAIAETEFTLTKQVQEDAARTARFDKLITDLGIEEGIKAEARLRMADNAKEIDLLSLTNEITASTRKLEVYKTELDNRVEMEKNADDIIREIGEGKLDRDKENSAALLSGTKSMFGGLASLTALGGKKMFKITKAFNIAEAITAGILSVQKAAASAPTPYNIPAIVGATAFSASNIARLSAQKAPSFENGGIVPGTGMTGDNTMARVNAGEMILNRRQQANMFKMVNGGSSSTNVNSNVVVEIDGEAIGRAVSKQVANGLQLGEVL